MVNTDAIAQEKIHVLTLEEIAEPLKYAIEKVEENSENSK